MIDPNELNPEQEETGETLEVETEVSDVEDTEDGGAILRYENDEQSARNTEHFANIVEEVDRTELAHTVNDLLEKITRDKEAREKRDKLYEEGLRRTGLADDAPGGASFSGATKVVHPMLVEACVDFSARVMKEVFPPAGPVKSKIYGPRDADKLEKAKRKTEFMNWQLTEQVTEFRGELEQLSTQLPLGGAQYLKWVWDAQRRRAVPEFVPVDDLILPFAATNFYTAERRTHVQYITEATYRKRVEQGIYADVSLPMPSDPEFSRSEQANQKIEGKTPTTYNEDGLRRIFEVSTRLDIEVEDQYDPYIIVIDDSTQTALGLYRNWNPDDENREELEHIVEFSFIPWRGSMPIGLTHLIGSLAAASTGALRALLDSAHINNIPSLLKLKGGPNGQTLNVSPTQVTEIDGSGMIDDIRKVAMPIPFNQPSPVLFQLLGFLVDAGKGVIQTSFEKLADGNPNAPVGTTLALIEQGMVVFSSIHSRMHASMARCFKILHRLNGSYLPEDDIERCGCGIEITPQDFDGPADVIPVSDPAIFSETQRFAQIQAVQQRSATMPQMYDLRKVEEMFLRTLKINPEDVLVEMPGKEDRDPVSENVAAIMGQPIYVVLGQEHLEHIKIHMAFLKSPMFGSNPAMQKLFVPPMARHLRDHVLNLYLSESHKAISKAREAGIPVDSTDAEVQLILSVQAAIEKEIGPFAQILAELDQLAQQMQPPQPAMPPDNSLQVAQIRAQVDTQKAQQDAQLRQAEMAQEAQLRQAEMAQAAQRDQMVAAQQVQLKQLEAQLKQQSEQIATMREQMRLRAEAEMKSAEIESRERMNLADNETAINIAAAEIASGEKVAVSNGTGINP